MHNIPSGGGAVLHTGGLKDRCEAQPGGEAKGRGLSTGASKVLGMGNLPLITDMLNGKWLERGLESEK